MSQSILERQHATWHNKPVLRAIYEDYYARITAACIPGLTLEIGSGGGNLKQFRSDVISTDLVATPWIDAAADAQSLPFANRSLANIVAVDVLHHLEYPLRFFAEASRTLEPGGRVVLVEPAITPVSGLFYRWFHPEPVDMRCNPFHEPPADPDREPFDANQAIPTLLFGKYRACFEHRFASFEIVDLVHLSFLAYPLSGGFRSWSALPSGAVPALLKLEDRMQSLLGRLMAFRLLIILERTDYSRPGEPRT